jgi:hypothetical protein
LSKFDDLRQLTWKTLISIATAHHGFMQPVYKTSNRTLFKQMIAKTFQFAREKTEKDANQCFYAMEVWTLMHWDPKDQKQDKNSSLSVKLSYFDGKNDDKFHLYLCSLYKHLDNVKITHLGMLLKDYNCNSHVKDLFHRLSNADSVTVDLLESFISLHQSEQY